MSVQYIERKMPKKDKKNKIKVLFLMKEMKTSKNILCENCSSKAIKKIRVLFLRYLNFIYKNDRIAYKTTLKDTLTPLAFIFSIKNSVKPSVLTHHKNYYNKIRRSVFFLYFRCSF